MNNKELWKQAAELVGEAELARRFRCWCGNLIKRELAKRANMTLSELSLQQAGEIVDDLNQLTGRRYTLSDETKALIRGRMSGGATVEDFKKVHRTMCGRWLDDAKMRDYLRPSTLYRAGHFDEYLALAPEREQKKENKTPSPEWRAMEAEAERKLAAKLMARPWYDFATWDEFMRWTMQFPTKDSLDLYEMPKRIRALREEMGLLKVLRGEAEAAEREYALLKAAYEEDGHG